MKISFDLDDTLILTNEGALHEQPIKRLYSVFYKERLRKGIINLCKELSGLGFDICVYTTSERSFIYIKGLFKMYGINLHTVINQKTHMSVVQGNRKEIMPSKVPSKFGINLHIDDDRSVKENGIQFGFNVCIISKEDEVWDQKVIEEAKRIKRMYDN
ncbi:MAG: HAD family hydrolase [Firmicutes bacterium]|nr:HAD family hydrolase [Bacillota bacterium]